MEFHAIDATLAYTFDGTALTDPTQVSGTWYPGYISRRDSSTLYFKYEASKFKHFEEPIHKTSREDMSRLRAGSGSGPSAPKKKPAVRKPAVKAKSPAKAKKKTVAKKPAAAKKKPAAAKRKSPAKKKKSPARNKK